MTQTGSSLVVVVHHGEIVERMGSIHQDTKENLGRLRRYLKNGDGMHQIPPESKDIIRGATKDLQWRSLPFDRFWGLVEQQRISVVAT